MTTRTAYLNALCNPAGKPVEANVSWLPAAELEPVRYRSGVHRHRQLLEVTAHNLAEAEALARRACEQTGLGWALSLLP